MTKSLSIKVTSIVLNCVKEAILVIRCKGKLKSVYHITKGNMEPTYVKSKTTEFFYKICFIVYLFGFPNFMFEDLKLSKRFAKIYNCINTINNAFVVFLLFLQIGAFYTQDKMNENQRLHLLVYVISTFMYCLYYSIFIYHKQNIRLVLSTLVVSLKSIHNDPEVEKQMMRKTLTYLYAVSCNCLVTMVMINAEGYMETVRNNVPYTTVVTAYPDIYDGSTSANICRVFINYTWWIFLSRVLGTYMLITPLASGLSHQYKNLCTYFDSLSEIIDREDLSQTEKEEMYEEKFIRGIKMHLDTLWCTRQIHIICNVVFSGQIVMNVFLLVILMAQMVQSDRNLTNLLTTLSTVCAVLVTTGLFMWNAGDITVEAAHLPTAIYFSGWHNCRGSSSTRIRKLVSVTITFAQRPVVLKGLGYIGLSYQSYLNIVKSSYSVFSVLF